MKENALRIWRAAPPESREAATASIARVAARVREGADIHQTGDIEASAFSQAGLDTAVFWAGLILSEV